MAKGKYEYWLTDDGLTLLEGWARDGLTDEQISEKIGVNRDTLYTWKKKYPDISDALKKGKEVIDRQVENALLKRALGFEYEEVTKERIVDTGQAQRHDEWQELTQEEWEFAKKYFNHECCYCGTITSKLTKDHVKPLQDDGKLTFDNVIPACQSCNSSKKDKEMMSWYQATSFYDQYRMSKIHSYLNFVIVHGQNLFRKGGSDRLVVTKVVTKMVAPDTTAQIFWLKNRKPNEYRDKRDVEHSGDLGLNNPFEELTKEQLLKLAGEDDG